MPRRGSTPPLPATYRHEASDQSKPHPPSKSRMQFPQSPHTRRHKNGRISTAQVHNLKCPEGNCMRNLSPADERPSQGLRTHIHADRKRFQQYLHSKTLPARFLGDLTGTKFAQQIPLSSSSETKFAQRSRKWPVFRDFGPAGRVLSRLKVRRWIAGRIFARSNGGRTIAPGPVVVVPGKQQAPENSHVIRLKEVSTNAENVAIPTRRIKDLKQSQGNYVRNW